MIGIRSAFSIRARGHRPHLEAVYMTAPRSVCRNTKKALPTGGRPYMTAVGLGERAFNYAQRFRKHHCHRPARPDDPVRRAVRSSITTVCGILDAPPARSMTSAPLWAWAIEPNYAHRFAANTAEHDARRFAG